MGRLADYAPFAEHADAAGRMPAKTNIINNPLKPTTAKGSMNQKKYLNFPIFMLNQTIINPDAGMSAISTHAIHAYADHCRRTSEDAIIQAAYVKTRRPDDDLPSDVQRIMNRADVAAFIETCEEAWLSEGDFIAGATDMLNDAKIRLEQDEQTALVNWLALRDAASYFNRIITNYDGFERNVEQIKSTLNCHAAITGKLATANVPADYFDETLQNHNNAEAMRLFRMVCAARSLIGKKKFIGTTKDMIRARMIGAKTHDLAATVAADNRVVKRELTDLQSRKRFDRILTEAAVRGFFTKLGKGRRIYLSTELRTPAELAMCITAKFNQHRRYNEAERAARQGAHPPAGFPHPIGAAKGQQ